MGAWDPVMGSSLHSAPQSGQKPNVADDCFSKTIISRLLVVSYGMFFLAL